mgnify:CR=1 FL=1
MASFKTDDSFLEKISIGAIGTQKVFQDLLNKGHHPIELERGSMNYKIWKKIKIKRIRVPDILLVDCGLRIESRAKTKLEISMSHSLADPERGWDFGMKDNDYVALVFCEKNGERPIDWKADELVQYVLIKDLREAQKQELVDYVKPKGAEEGFEARITWPSAVASENGKIKLVAEDKIQYIRDSDGRTISLRLTKKSIPMKSLVKVGDQIVRNQIIASVVPVYSFVNKCDLNKDYYLDNLKSSALSERYAAAKALSFYKSESVAKQLLNKLKDSDEHIYVKLESAATLARFEMKEGYSFIEECLKNEYAQYVLESVIILAEIKTSEACKILTRILSDIKYDPEIRAGAAWALGEQNDKKSLNALVKSFNEVDKYIKVEAARALAKLAKSFNKEIVAQFNTASEIEKPGVAWALTKSPTLKLDDILSGLTNMDSRQWISYIIGYQDQGRFIKEIEKIKSKDPEVYFAVTVLWKILNSWVAELKEYG